MCNTSCLFSPGVPPRNAILITTQRALEDIRTIQKNLGGSSALPLNESGFKQLRNTRMHDQEFLELLLFNNF